MYRIEEDGRVKRVVGKPAVADPNSLMLSPNDRTVYETDRTAVRAFALNAGGRSRTHRARTCALRFPGRGGDGLAIDREGRPYVAAGHNQACPGQSLSCSAGIYAFSPEGREERFVPVPEDPVSNVAFGGDDDRVLFITAVKRVFRHRNLVPGLRR